MTSEAIIPSFAMIPKYMVLDHMRLRPLRISDGQFLFDRLKDNHVIVRRGGGGRISVMVPCLVAVQEMFQPFLYY